MTNEEAVQPDVPDTAVIDTEGLDEQIRCEMCRNPMHTDRGCDGNCKYDEKLYEKIMQILDERIKPLPSAQPDVTDTNVGDMISRRAAIDAFYEMASDIDHLCTVGDYVHVLEMLSPAQPKLSCDGCKHLGMFENEIEYGYTCPCLRCVRRMEDNYER